MRLADIDPPAASRRLDPGPAGPGDGQVIDMEATIVVAHSEKEQAAATFKHTYGYQPSWFLDRSGEFEPKPKRGQHHGS